MVKKEYLCIAFSCGMSRIRQLTISTARRCVMKRAITIIAAFVVAALLTVAAQATSREGLSFEQKTRDSGEHLGRSETSHGVSLVKCADRGSKGAVTVMEDRNMSH
jgi:hypothetical protein